eukprot:11453502-Karenia_brevis.AAC.1
MQFHSENVDVVGIQEGRATTNTTRNGLHYTMFVSKADADGNYGCQIWISNRLRFKLHELEVITPRIMLIAGVANTIKRKLQIIAAHAPCEQAPLRIKDAFWKSLTSTCMRLKRRTPTATMWIAIDGNGRLSPDEEGAVGSCEPDAISDNGLSL